MGKSNVHPDHYKIAGRERQGEDVVPELEKAKATTQQQQRKPVARRPKRRAGER